MLALGISDGITSGAAVVHDGRVLAAVNEERLVRKKMAFGFPRRSIAEVLRLAGASPGDIDVVAPATVNGHFQPEVQEFDGWLERDKGLLRNLFFGAASRFAGVADAVPGVEALYYGLRSPAFAARRRGVRAILREEFGIEAPLEFIDHHLAHAASAYFTSGFRNATVVTMDGGGDGHSSHVYLARDGRMTRLWRTSAYNSLANYYAYVTHLCGYRAQRHEGKITGLAAHGSPVHRGLLEEMITIRDGAVRNTGRVLFQGAVEALESRLPAGWRKEDLAASIQAVSESVARDYVRHHLHEEGEGNVALAGGLFANVRINQEIHALPGVRRLFVHPGMTDVGLAVGAALALCLPAEGRSPMARPREAIGHVYWGPSFGEAEIREALEAEGLPCRRGGRIEAEIARLLAAGHVVARFDGAMEYGPRALGNRSILCHPADPTVNDWLNESLRRTEFMPFAPATLAGRAGRCYRDLAGAEETARFMTITFHCTGEMKRTSPGVVHLDGTARPQLVEPGEAPGLHGILREFEALTGVPSIINTSFNMHEEPIVCTPRDAVRAFLSGHLDYLAIGDYLVPSPVKVTRTLRPMPRAAGRDPA